MSAAARPPFHRQDVGIDSSARQETRLSTRISSRCKTQIRNETRAGRIEADLSLGRERLIFDGDEFEI